MSLLNPIPRDSQHGARSIRWDEAWGAAGDDAIALSVADMDFRAPQPVIDAISSRAFEGNYGYTYVSDSFYDAVTDWFTTRHGWSVSAEWIVPVGRVVETLPAILTRFTSPGAKVVVPVPSYGPIPQSIVANGREVVPWQLALAEVYTFDFAALGALLDQGAEALILINPHNPTGRVWTRDELTRVADMAQAAGVLVISDELHCDLLRAEEKFTPYLTCVNPDARAIALTSPSKTFNLAGLEITNIIVPNETLRRQVRVAVADAGAHNPRFFAETATLTAYRKGGPWVDELLELIDHHVRLVRRELAQNCPGVKMIGPEGTYLAWLDCRSLGLTDEQLNDYLVAQGLVLTPGTSFGEGGSGFMRMNLAVSTPDLQEALIRLASAFS